MEEAVTLVKDPIARPDEPRHFMVLKALAHQATASVGDRQLARAEGSAIRVQEAGYDLYDPVVYFARDDVAMQHLQAIEKSTHCPLKGDTEYFDVVVDGTTYPEAAWSYTKVLDFDERLGQLLGRIAFDTSKIQVTEHTAG